MTKPIRMKKLVITVLSAVAFPMLVQAQGKADLTDAILAYRNNDLGKAFDKINFAIKSQQLQQDPKAWRYLFEIWSKGILVNDPKVKAGAGDSGGIVVAKAFNKVLELEKGGGEHTRAVKQTEANVKILLFNAGVEEYNKNNYGGALKNFEYAAKISPKDTNITYLRMASYLQKEEPLNAYNVVNDFDKAGNKPTVSMINPLINATKRLRETPEGKAAYLNVLAMGTKHYPERLEYMQEEIYYLLEEKKNAEAHVKIDGLLAKDPKNASFHYINGVLYQQEADVTGASPEEVEKKSALAKESYTKATELDPKNFDAWYNLGTLSYNKAKKQYDVVVDFQNKSFKAKTPAARADLEKKASAAEKTAQETFRQALPAFSKAYELKKDDRNVVLALMNIYGKIKDEPNYKKFEAEFNKLK